MSLASEHQSAATKAFYGRICKYPCIKNNHSEIINVITLNRPLLCQSCLDLFQAADERGCAPALPS
jgi:hypothetical protein